MDASKTISEMGDYLESYYHAQILNSINKGTNHIEIDFSDLMKHNPDLASTFLDDPEDMIRAMRICIQNFDRIETDHFDFHFTNLPESASKKIRNIRIKNLNKIIIMQGIVRQKSDVRPQIMSASFECPSCGAIIRVNQIESKFVEPSRCSCGRKGKFRIISKNRIDSQGIVLEECSECLEGNEQAKKINLWITRNLCSPMADKTTNPGSKIKVVGILKEIPIIQNGIKTVKEDYIVEVNNIQSLEEDVFQLNIKDKKIDEIRKLASDKEVYNKLIQSIAPTIYGYDIIKESILLQLFGGVRKDNGGSIIRGDIHILLVGDPGVSKSQFLKRICNIAPKSRYVCGRSASGAGMTASVVKDEFMKGWALEGGAMVLANNGLCGIDELDKMNEDDSTAMHEALEQQTISINKANIQATLTARTSVLAAANPKYGRFDPYEQIAKQINLKSSLINRFDLIFIMRDLPCKDKDRKLAKFVLNLHMNGSKIKSNIDTDLLRKYIAFARKTCKPRLTQKVLDKIEDYYVDIRNQNDESTKEDLRPIPLNTRQLEALIRLSEASAKIRLSDEVESEDIDRAMRCFKECLNEVVVDPITGKLDIDRIATDTPSSEKMYISTINNKLKESGNEAELLILRKECFEVPDDMFDNLIDKMKQKSEIFEPRVGFIKKLR